MRRRRPPRAKLIAMRWGKSPEPVPTELGPVCVPDYAEPLRAWRLWEVEWTNGAPRLRSLFQFCFWPVGAPLEARCHAYRFRLRRRARHTAPDEGCTCGIYAVPYEYIRKLTLGGDSSVERTIVLGTVLLWGDVVECERGWRAAYAYPSRIFVPRACQDAEETALGLQDYLVPVEVLDAYSLPAALEAVAALTAVGTA